MRERSARKMADELHEIHKLTLELTERARSLKASADHLRDIAFVQRGASSGAMSDAHALHSHIDWLVSALEQASSRSDDACDVASESNHLLSLRIEERVSS